MTTFKTIFIVLSGMFTELPVLLKVAVFLGVWLGLWLPFAIPQSRRLKWRPGLSLSPDQRLPLLGSLYLMAPIVVGITIPMENSSFSEYGLMGNGATFASVSWGFFLGVLGLVLLFTFQSILGGINWRLPHRENQDLSSSIPSRWVKFLWESTSVGLTTFFLALWIAGTEELIFRGVLQNLLQPAYSQWTAVAIVSLIFALLHLLWDIQETLPQIPGLWLMGMILAWARIVDGGSIALPWGIHAGWVWGMVSLDTADILCYTGKIPQWVSGISGKPLAGLLGIILLLATGTAIGF